MAVKTNSSSIQLSVKHFALISFAVLVFMLAACSQPSEWQEQYDLGVRYLSEGNYKEAIIAFSAAIKIEPKLADAYIGRGQAYIGLQDEEGNLELALADYMAVIGFDTENVEAYLGAADVYIRMGDYDKALEILQQGAGNIDDQRITDKISELEESLIISNNDNINILAERFFNSNNEGVQIIGLSFDNNRFLSGAKTDFEITVAYKCPDNNRAYLLFGANTSESDSYDIFDGDCLVNGSGIYKTTLSLDPTFYEDTDFTLYSNMSKAEDIENKVRNWMPINYDTICIDRTGDIYIPKE